MFDAHQLNVFLVAAETLNFTQAAKHLNMTQPSVSQHIQKLEHRFNTQLFYRSGRFLELTDTGKKLVPLARALVNLSNNIEETMSSLGGEVYGHLDVVCSTTPGKYVLPLLLAKFNEDYPLVTLSCQVTSQVQAAEMLNEGIVNFALSSTTRESFRQTEYFRLMSDPVTLIAHCSHPWALQGNIEPYELYDGTFLQREKESGTYLAVREALYSVGVDIAGLKTLLVLGNSEAIALAVEEGLGVGFVSQILIEKLMLREIAPVKVHGLEICRDIFIGCQTRHKATVAQKAFWEFIQRLDNSFQQELNTANPRKAVEQYEE